jgi:hypothetical protein
VQVLPELGELRTAARCKRFGPNDDASDCSGRKRGGVIRQGGRYYYSRLEFLNSSQHGLGVSESEFIIYGYGAEPAVSYCITAVSV